MIFADLHGKLPQMMVEMEPGQGAPLFWSEGAESVVRSPGAVEAAGMGVVEVVEQAFFLLFEHTAIGDKEKSGSREFSFEFGFSEHIPLEQAAGEEITLGRQLKFAQSYFQRHIGMGEHLGYGHFSPLANGARLQAVYSFAQGGKLGGVENTFLVHGEDDFIAGF